MANGIPPMETATLKHHNAVLNAKSRRLQTNSITNFFAKIHDVEIANVQYALVYVNSASESLSGQRGEVQVAGKSPELSIPSDSRFPHHSRGA